ncbi:hypothetical protein AB2T90_17215 [Clostridium butyricum]|uniref:hypothetical protein n=1 Tax=Clostridium butyricum TaxID=1492 RepID=UPI003466DC5B
MARTKKISNDELKEAMEEKTRCSCCGRILVNSNFYVSSSITNKNTGRLNVCKDCLTNIYIEYLNELEDSKKAIYKICRLMDFVFLEQLYNSSVTEVGWDTNLTIVENGLSVWKKYIKNVTSLKQYKEYTFEHGEEISLKTNEISNENLINIKNNKPKTLSEEELKQKVLDKQNKEDVIRIIGYDPFENEIEEDKSKLYAKLVNMLNDDTSEDEMKISALISIIKGQNQENKINDAITSMSSNIADLKNNIGTIKSMTDTKEKLNKSILAIAKDNKLTDLWSGHKSAGANTLSGMVKKLKELDLNEAQVNLFDIQTSLGMLQVARLSNQAIVDNLNFGDDDLLDMVKFQKGKMEYYETEYSKLKEENRKLKAICNFNDINYKEDIFETEYDDLNYDNKTIESNKKELEDFNNMVKEVIPLNINDYADKVIKDKEEITKQKILDEVNEKK